METLCKITIWLDGKFVHEPKLKYVGGRKSEVDKVSLDYMNMDLLFQIYHYCGGKVLTPKFYFLYPGQTLEMGLKRIVDDTGIPFMVNVHEGLGFLTLYTEESGIEPLLGVDTNGSIIYPKVLRMGYGEEGIEADEVLETTVDSDVQTNTVASDEQGNTVAVDEQPNAVASGEQENAMTGDALEENAMTGDALEANAMTGDENEENARTNEPEYDEEIEEEIARARAAFEEELASERATFEDEIASERVIYEEEIASTGEPAYEVPTNEEPLHNTTTYEDFEGDDSSDDDYIQADDVESSEDDVDSNAPSEELEDIEGSSDDDIFVDRQPTKKELIKKLNKMGKKAMRPNKRVQRCTINPSTVHSSQWFSDAEDDDNIENLDDPQRAKCPTFTEFQSMKNRNLEELMKFSNIGIFREALTDWVVRNGYELEYIKNERSRVTAECKESGCNWRIHASVVQGGPTFQIKTIKGEHTCSRKRVNKHTTAKYIGKRMEDSIKDNPDVPIQKLGYSVLRKVGVEAGYWKTLEK